MKNTLFVFFSLLFSSLWATHNRAGEITYRSLGGNTYEARITTYTRACALCADRCELTINWGDGETSVLPRVNGASTRCPQSADGVIIGDEIRKNIYLGQHTYETPGAYTLSFEDANRNAGINNIINSDQFPFYVESEIFIANSLGANSSPILTNPPVEKGCINKRFEHSAGAFDPDGDSLSYELDISRTTDGDPIPTIYDPQYVQDSIKIDSRTGILYWDVPQNVGQFNFAFKINEWRKNRQGRYTRIGYVVRDLQVDIEDCGNNPPKVQPVGPFCIEAGKALNFDVTATDPDGDDLKLTAFGGPFEVSSPADNFEYNGPEPLTGNFNWQTNCSHVRQQPYQVTFKAEDVPQDQFDVPLSDLYTAEITVVAPAPKNPLAEAEGMEIDLSWNRSICSGAAGYKIYRREALYGFFPDSCELDVPAYTEYELIDSNAQGITDTLYTDSDSLQLGVEYCYMVVAYFPDEAVSYASVEFCASLPLSLPLPIKVDVDETSATSGIIDVAWVAPPELDSNLFPPPYEYELQRANGIQGNNFSTIATLPGLEDTAYTDQNLDTESRGYRYRIVLYSGPNRDSVGASSPASSVFLELTGEDESVELDMTHFTPWQNQRFVIFRENPSGSGTFDSIAESFSPLYTDTGLVNGNEYCYYVKSYGRYTANDSLPMPLINRSQKTCATARDTKAPCTPQFSLSTVCPDTVYFSWQQPNNSGCSDDVIQYNIYFKPEGGSFGSEPVLTIAGTGDSTVKFVNDSELFGCYAISATDDAGQDPNGSPNESPLSEEICLESCFQIRFPNVFSPNQDGFNDFFLPIEYNQLERLRVDIYNRWGSKVYSASSLEEFVNPGWDGTVELTGQPASQGVYYYVCRYQAKGFNTGLEQVATGFVHLFR